MSPEARRPAIEAPSRPSLGRDAVIGVAIALPVALVISRVNPATYRSGAATIAFLVVLGLAMRWTVAFWAAPLLVAGILAQVTDDFSEVPDGADLIGSAVILASMAVVLLALRRWEGDRRRAREEAQARMRNERRLQALVDLAHHLAMAADRAALYSTVERQVPLAAGSSGAILVVRSGDQVEFAAISGHDRADFPAHMPSAYVTAGTPAVDVFEHDIPVFCPSAAELLERYPALTDYITRSRQNAWAALPVPEVGALVLTWREEQVFSSAQRAFLVTIANLLSAAAERVRSVEQAELWRFLGAFDAMLDGVGIHRVVRDPSGTVVDLEVEYVNPEAVGTDGDRADMVGRRMSDLWPRSPLLPDYARVVETGEPFVLEDADVSTLGGPYSDVTTVSIRASRLDADRIVLVVRDVSERARLAREVREANEVFSVAQQLAHVGSWRYDFLADRLEWSAELYRIVGVPEDEPPTRPVDGSLFGFEHPDDRGLIIENIRAALADRSPFAFDMRIIRQDDGEVREVSTSGIVLTDPEGNLLGVWGATQDITERRRAERLRREALHALALQRAAVAEMQRVILPAAMPAVAGVDLAAHYRAATLPNAVGGDWYDAFATPDGRLVLAIGDVAGHGIECAALANQLRVSVRVRVNDGMEPAEILELLDRELGDGFVTCWLAVYEPDARRLRIANAGHLPAVLGRCGDAHLVAAQAAPPLGTQCVSDLHEEELVLESGDLLVLYTDGLIERRGEQLDAGFELLTRTVLCLDSVADPAFALVEQLAPDASDDVCVLTMRVR